MDTRSHREGCSYLQSSRCPATRHPTKCPCTHRAEEGKSVLKGACSIFHLAFHFLSAETDPREGAKACSRQYFQDHSLDSCYV